MGILGFIYFAIMSITAYPKYLIIKKKSILTTGTIIDLKDIKCKYIRIAKLTVETYIYNLEIDIEGQKIIAEYSEIVLDDANRTILNGTSLEVFYNSSNNKAFNAAQLKKDIWEYPVHTLIIALIIAILFIIYHYI